MLGGAHTAEAPADRCLPVRTEVSELSESVISALFACPLDSTSSLVNTPSPCPSRATPRLAEFIAYALHRTRLPDEITFQALFLLRRLKSRFPAARGSSGHRLFISALMLASKSSCDDTYSNKSWTIVSQGLFSLREVNQMERELFGYLGFKVNVEMDELTLFRDLLLSGDIVTVLEGPSPQCSPNPASPSVDSPTMDRGCDTPTSAQTPTKCVSVDSAPTACHRQQSVRHGNRTRSISSYPGDASSASPCSVPNMYTRSGSIPYERQHPFQTGYSQPGTTSSAFTNLSPSSASVSSSRGSISSASGCSATPSPSMLSHSESSSSRTTPDTPPSDLCSSPWTDADEKASSYSDEPAGTYDDNIEFYQHLKHQQYYAQHQQQPYVYAAPSATSTRTRHPYA